MSEVEQQVVEQEVETAAAAVVEVADATEIGEQAATDAADEAEA